MAAIASSWVGAGLAFMHPAFTEAFEAAIATFLQGLIVETADAA
jgi:hypothetical protein